MPSEGSMKPKYKIKGSGRKWYVMRWNSDEPPEDWKIVGGPFTTQQRTISELKRFEPDFRGEKFK